MILPAIIVPATTSVPDWPGDKIMQINWFYCDKFFHKVKGITLGFTFNGDFSKNQSILKFFMFSV
jgi:hypothetical protein